MNIKEQITLNGVSQTSSEAKNQCENIDNSVNNSHNFDLHNNPCEAIKADIEQLANPANMFADVLVDYSKELQLPEIILADGENPIFTRGNISCISGKAKSRKSFLVALLCGEYLKTGGKVLVIDTEQSKYHAGKAAKRICTLAELSDNQLNERLTVLQLREKDTKVRRNITEQAIIHFKPDLVFIDGIRDLIYSINDEHEAITICNLLMRLSSEHNIHICSILHQNKTDENARGHIGTELLHKSAAVFRLSKQDDTTKVEPLVCRDIEFKAFNFFVNENGLPERCLIPTLPTEREREIELYCKIFETRKPMCYTDLVNAICKNVMGKKGEPITEDAGKKRVTKATSKGYVIKNQSGMYELNPKYQARDAPDNENDDI